MGTASDCSMKCEAISDH